jgi:hypothetical protein
MIAPLGGVGALNLGLGAFSAGLAMGKASVFCKKGFFFTLLGAESVYAGSGGLKEND